METSDEGYTGTPGYGRLGANERCMRSFFAVLSTSDSWFAAGVVAACLVTRRTATAFFWAFRPRAQPPSSAGTMATENGTVTASRSLPDTTTAAP